MTDSNLLRSIINKSGLKYRFIAEKLGITPYGLQKKIDNKTEFKASEVKIICELVGIIDLEEREKIFFADKVELKSTKRSNKKGA